MRIIRLSLFLFSCILFVAACSKSNNPQHQLVGEWRVIKTKVSIHSFNNTKRDSVLSVEEADFPEKLDLGSTITNFYIDNTYSDKYFSKTDSLIHVGLGKWKLVKDTLFFLQQKPVNQIFTSTIKLNDTLMVQDTQLDWDSDGDFDDKILNVYKRQK